MIRHTTTLALALLAISCSAMTASAQSTQAPKKQPTPQQLDRAREYFDAAEAAKARRDYLTAAADYLAAYQLFDDAEFFFDAGEMYRLAGSEDTALTYYQKYLDLDPGGRGVPAARAAVAELRRAIGARGDASRRRSAASVDDRRGPDPTASIGPSSNDGAPAERPVGDVTATQSRAPGSLAPDSAPPSPFSHSPAQQRGLRIAGIATGALGLGALGVGVAFGIRAHSISDEASQWTTFDKARYDQGNAANRDMWIFTGAGVAAVIAGSVLYYLGHVADASQDAGRTRITLALPDGTSAVSVRAEGHF